MSETLTETRICDICGAEVRDGSLYCYNCGGSVAKGSPMTAEAAVADQADRTSPELRAGGNGTSKTVERRERPKRRVSSSSEKQIIWEPKTGLSFGMIVGTLIFVLIVMGLLFAAYLIR